MSQAKGPTGGLPTWEALREPSIASGDGDSDTDELDQIRATPAPTLTSRPDRPVYKRKESDWKTEPAPKRAKHEKSHSFRDNSKQLTVKPRSASGSEVGSDGVHRKSSTVLSRSARSMQPPPLPSRLKDAAHKPFTSDQPSSENQPTSTPRPLILLTASSSTLNSTPVRTKDIPSSLDSTLFSNVSSKLGAQSRLHRSPQLVPDPSDVIEISSESSDTPPSPLIEKGNPTFSTPSSLNRRPIEGTPKQKEKTSTTLCREVIEILESDEEQDTQRASSQSLRTPVFRASQPPKRTPSTPRMTTKGNLGPKALKYRVQDTEKNVQATTGSSSAPAANPSPSMVKQVANQSSLPTQSRSALGRSPLFARYSRMTSSKSKEASKSASVSDDENINMRDLNLALGLPLPSKKGKGKEDAPSTLSTPRRQLRLLARKSVGGRPPPLQLAVSPTFKSATVSGCSAASAIDLTGDISDEDAVEIVSRSSKNGKSASSSASDMGRIAMQLSPVLPPPSAKLVSPAALSLPQEHSFQTKSNPPLLESATSPPLKSPFQAPENAIYSDQAPPPESSLASAEQSGPLSLSPNIGKSANVPVSIGLPHTNCHSTLPPTEIHQQTTAQSPSESASVAESRSPSAAFSISKHPLLPCERNTTKAPSSLASSNVDETHSQPASQVDLPQAALNEMRLSSETEDIAEKLLAGNGSDDAMRDADELEAMVGDGVGSMDEEPPVSDDEMCIDGEAGHPSEGLLHSQSTIKTIRPSVMSLRTSSDSGMDASSEPGLGLNSPVSVPSTRRSSRLSLYSNTSEADAQRRSVYSMPSSRSTSPDDVGAFKRHTGTLGGFPAFRFESYRMDPKNFPKVFYAADLPSSIQDHINNQPEDVRMLGENRGLFEAMILENTADDEREAPAIMIQNDVDDEPTPAWEFWYSNKMWHGKGVPDPDMKNLKGCDCKGACNPKNKACACAQRQCEVIGDKRASEFAYDKNGRLKYPGFPIFECNNTCWCGPECANRVVQHGRKVPVAIRKTKSKGWGAFNGSKKIPQGTFIGIYAGELLTDEEAHMRGLKYNKVGTTYLFDLDFHHLKEGAEGEEEWTSLYTVDAYHAGNFTRFLNHSCNPNSRLYPCYINEGDVQKPLLVVFSIRDIEPEEEICFNYQGIYPGEEDDEESQPNEDNDEPKDKIYTKCLCGATNCRGIMFSY